jgi:hypothetical protein
LRKLKVLGFSLLPSEFFLLSFIHLHHNGIYKVSGIVLVTENAEIKDGVMDTKNYMLVR